VKHAGFHRNDRRFTNLRDGLTAFGGVDEFGAARRARELILRAMPSLRDAAFAGDLAVGQIALPRIEADPGKSAIFFDEFAERRCPFALKQGSELHVGPVAFGETGSKLLA
jgi:hypothetical protein